MDKKLPICIVLVMLMSCFSCKQPQQPTEDADMDTQWVDSSQHLYQYGICIDSLDVKEYLMKNGDNPASIFSGLGFTALKADSISRASTHVLDPTKLRAGMHYYTFSTVDSLETIRYIAFAKSLTDYAVIDLTGDTINAYEFNKPITLKKKYTEGVLNSSLWNVIKANGGDPYLAIKISDVYAWQIDFFDIKDGDSFKVLYNEAYIDDTTALSIASIEGAIFTHQGKEFVAIPFTQDSIFEYFDEEGNSLRKAFLKAPLDFFRITSRFTNARFHPILKRYRAHHGVDYAAPTGTPVRSIGAGTVIAKGYQNGGGNFLKVKHNSVYTTTYMHLSRFAKGIQVGSHVQQGQEIAYVGSTGLSTGPHLDFRVHKNGQPIDPLKMEATVICRNAISGDTLRLDAEAVLLATGRKPNTESLNLQAAGIRTTNRGAIEVDSKLRTNIPNIWAIGDVHGGLQFTYLSLDDYRIIREELFGNGFRSLDDREAVAYSVFIDPPLAHVGLNETQARKMEKNIKVASLPAAAMPRTRTIEQTDGLLKAVVDADTGKILGCTLFCAESSEVINTVSLAMRLGQDYTFLRDSIFTHPSMSEALNDLFGLIK